MSSASETGPGWGALRVGEVLDGTYRVEGLIAADYTLTPEKPGYTFQTAGGAEWTAAPGDVRDWIASPVVSIGVSAGTLVLSGLMCFLPFT